MEGALSPLFCCSLEDGWDHLQMPGAAPCGSVSTEGFPGCGSIMGLALQVKVSLALGREGQETVSIMSLQQNYSGHGFLQHMKQKSLWKLAIAAKQKRDRYLQLSERESHTNCCILLQEKRVFQKL